MGKRARKEHRAQRRADEARRTELADDDTPLPEIRTISIAEVLEKFGGPPAPRPE